MTKQEKEIIVKTLELVSKINNINCDDVFRMVRRNHLHNQHTSGKFRDVDSLVNWLLVNIVNDEPITQENIFGSLEDLEEIASRRHESSRVS